MIQITCKQDHLRMNIAPDQTIILGRQIVLDHRSLSSIGQKILTILPPRLAHTNASISFKEYLFDETVNLKFKTEYHMLINFVYCFQFNILPCNKKEEMSSHA